MTMSIIELMHQIVKEPAPRLGPEGRFSKDAEAFVDACLMKDVEEKRTPGELIVSSLLLFFFCQHYWIFGSRFHSACVFFSTSALYSTPSYLPCICALFLPSFLFLSSSFLLVLMMHTRRKWPGYNNVKRARRISRPGSRTFNHPRSHLCPSPSLTISSIYALLSMQSR